MDSLFLFVARLRSNQLQSRTYRLEVCNVGETAESILCYFELTQSHQFFVLTFDAQVAHCIDHVTETVATRCSAALIHLIDAKDVGVVGLCPLAQALERTDRGLGGDPAGAELTVFDALEGVDEEESTLTRVTLTEPVDVGDELIHVGLAADADAAGEVEAGVGPLELVEGFFGRVEHHQVTLGGERGGHGEAEGGLARARFAREEGDHGGGEALATKALVEPVDAGGDAFVQVGRNLDVEDVGAEVGGVLELDAHSVSIVFVAAGAPLT